MRILVSALLGVLFSLFAQSAFAACGSDALGTHRTIVLDPKEHKFFIGDEKRLGLKHKEVILTFDDGPIGSRTRRVLKALRHECVKATFFAVGEMAKEHRKLLRRIVRDGHTLGHHTHGHNRLPHYSVKKASRLIDKGISTIEKIAYGNVADTPRVPFFRYPYLAHNRATDRMVAKKGMIVFDTNIDSSDWHPGASPSLVHNRIMRRLRKAGKGIILMHDIHHRTARMLPRLLRSLKREGYKVVHMVPPALDPQIAPVPDTPVVLASADDKDPVAKKPSSIVVLKPVKPSDNDVSIVEISKPVGSPAAAHGTEIELENITLLNSKRSNPTSRPAPTKPGSLVSPETTGNTVRRPDEKNSIVTHSIKARSGGVVSAASLKSRRWKLRSSKWALR